MSTTKKIYIRVCGSIQFIVEFFFYDRPNYITIAAYRILKIKADLQDNTDSYSILFIYF